MGKGCAAKRGMAGARLVGKVKTKKRKEAETVMAEVAGGRGKVRTKMRVDGERGWIWGCSL